MNEIKYLLFIAVALFVVLLPSILETIEEKKDANKKDAIFLSNPNNIGKKKKSCKDCKYCKFMYYTPRRGNKIYSTMKIPAYCRKFRQSITQNSKCISRLEEQAEYY